MKNENYIPPYSKKLMALTMTLVLIGLVLLSAGPAQAVISGQISGKFRTSAAPVIASIVVYEAGTDIVPISLTPQQEYDIKVTVTEPDGIGDLDWMHIKFWFDASGEEVTEADYDKYPLMEALDQHDCAAIMYRNPNSSYNYAYMYASSVGNSCTWDLDESYFNFPSEAQREDPSYLTHEYTYRVKIGKVARETSGSQKCQIGVKVGDVSGNTDYLHWGSGVPMNWYGEVVFRDSLGSGEIVDTYTFQWQNVHAGIDFSESSHALICVDTYYISNGDYYQQIKAQTVWESQGDSPDAILSADAAEPNSFALKALNNIQRNNAVLLDPGGGWVTIPFDFTQGLIHGGITPHGGYRVPGHTNESYEYPYWANSLWLKLNPVFAKDVYSGTITYGIVNRT